MKKSKNGVAKILAAVIIGLVLILMVSIAANGWQNDIINNNKSENSGEYGDKSENTDNTNGDTDINNGTADNNTQDTLEVIKPVPQYLSSITGLEISQELVGLLPYALIYEPNAPLYGISDSELTIEIPTENGNTRFIVYKTDISKLGKIGSLAPTRKNISQLTKLFGGILVAYGSDDIVSYDHIPSTLHIDMLKYKDYVYKENGKNVYTDNKNLNTLTDEEGLDKVSYKDFNLPFTFADYYDSVKGNTSAKSIIIPYAENETKFIYNELNGLYKLTKGNKDKIDMLTGSSAEYKNLFVLFSDVITYETSAGTQSVTSTASEGSGYYITNGTLTEIRWSVNDGNMVFKDLSGNVLSVNRGNSYISYYKSSDSFSVSFE